jgi:putative SOS response-associated peptidase YedK
MCGRYTLIRLADFTDMFPWIRPGSVAPPARYNIAPTQSSAVITNDGSNTVHAFRWGLIPSWAKDESIGARLINARMEGVVEKPAFRAALRRRRCLVPASGFYEWNKNPDGKSKTPMLIRMRDARPFAFAGLWETWNSPDGSRVCTFTILTGEPNDLVRAIHDRMAVILRPEDYHAWLRPDEVKDPAELIRLLQVYPAELMEAYPVSRAVNSPANDRPELIEPVHADSAPAAAPVRRRRPPAVDQPGLF